MYTDSLHTNVFSGCSCFSHPGRGLGGCPVQVVVWFSGSKLFLYSGHRRIGYLVSVLVADLERHLVSIVVLHSYWDLNSKRLQLCSN